MTQIDAREIRGLLQRDVMKLLGKLFPNCRVTSPVFTPLNPTRDDKTPGSFVIWTSGPAAGGFNEYSPRGYGVTRGDVVDLIAYVHRKPGDRAFAFAWARDFLGIRSMSDAERRAAKASARAVVTNARASQSEANAARRQKALNIWTRTQPLIGSLAEHYLAARRIPYALIRNREDDLRFIPKLEHWKSIQWDKSVSPWVKLHSNSFPAMVAAIRNFAGDITGIHCTFLRADGTGKADVAEAKLMRGDAKGSAIRLTRGDGNMTLDDARTAGVLQPFMPFEGIENALSYALEVPEARVWACGSFDLMLALQVETEPTFDPVIYGLDNDDNAKAADAITDRIEAVRSSGKDCSSARPPAGVKDFNDLIRDDD